MTRRRWIADEFSENRAALTGEHADHLVRVLRVRVGQEFDIAVGDQVRRGSVLTVEPRRVEFELGEVVSSAQSVNITLLLSIFKFHRMEWAIEKCTELGVLRIVPVIARRSDAHLAASSAKRVERWRKIALQAAEQSRRAAPAEISEPAKLKDAVGGATGLRILLSESERQVRLSDILNSHVEEVTLAIGPEGGWTEDELQIFRDAGWISASLGSTILRAETAAIAATSITISGVSQ
ncbi:MAG TPA: RsmE family RNA methyltransferase [Candidatus Solibacter sp.]|nr:RsmE family RNA methyltransferase [Candidatus Solibacter sp.]